MTTPYGTIWHPFTQHGLNQPAIHIDRAAGAYLFAREGRQEKRIIDAISSWWVITHGHCHPHIINSVQQQSSKLDQVIFAGFTHDPAEILASKLTKLSGHNHIFFSDSGSTSVEVALKMAIGYWAQTGKPRRKIIALDGGYHGDTFGAMSAGARSVYSKLYEPYLFDVLHIPFPEAGQESKTFDALEDIRKAHKNDIAAFIFEPLIQGAGGMRIYSPEVLKTLADICAVDDILLIADEVMTGFGRTGTFFACEQAGIKPDLLCLSKGITGGTLPLGVTLCTQDIYKAFYHEDRGRMFFHSSSFTGNPMACAAACANIDIWENEPVQSRIDTIAAAHANHALTLQKRSDISNLRQKGTILAFEYTPPENTEHTGYLSGIQPALYAAFLAQNLLLRPLGNTVYILPPYCVTKEDLHDIYNGIHIALDSLGHERQ